MRHSLLAVVALAAIAASPAAGTSAQAPQRGGTVVFGTPIEPACLNILVARCYGAGSPTLAFLGEKVLEPAFDVGPEFTWRPRLVSGATFTRQPPFTLTYRIRPRARWSDGVPVTARDFVFTLRARMSRRAELASWERVLVDHVRRVDAVDAKTVRVVVRSRLAGWRALFGNILPRHALAGQNLSRIWSDRIVSPKTGQPIGSGPFLVGRWERGRQLTLVRNPRYWGAHRAYLERLVLRFQVEGDNPLAWFRRGELDIAHAFAAPPDAISALRRERGLRVVTPPSSTWEHFAIRVGPGGHPALRNKLVRRALAYGIDRMAFVRQVLRARPNSEPLDSLVLVKPSRYYRANWSRYRHRPVEARRLLEQAGCRRGADGIYVCAGERLSLRFVTGAGIPPRAQLLSLAQAQLRQVGIEVLPSFAPPPVFLGQILPRGDFDVALFGWFFDPTATGFEDVFGCGGVENYTGYCQRLVTRDLDQASRILDAGEQARVLNRADKQMARDVPAIPLYQIPLPTAYRATLRNYVPASNPLTTAENWWLER